MGLKKQNPLFLDSTQPVGDKLITNVELLNVQLKQGQSLYFEVTDSFGVMQKFVLKQVLTKKSVRYCAELWLNQGEQIHYRFLLMSDGQELQTTRIRDVSAGVFISESWAPMSNLEFQEVLSQRNAQSQTSKKKITATNKKARAIKNLTFTGSQDSFVKSEDFQQLKLLLGELE